MILRGFFIKYEKKYQGVFVVTIIENESLSTSTITSNNLGDLSGKEIISLYLIAVRSQRHADLPIRYFDVAFSDSSSASSSQSEAQTWKSTADQPKILSNSDAVNNPLKRQAPPIDLTQSSSEVNTRQTSKVLTEVGFSKTTDNNNIATKNSQPSKNLMNFFGKK